MDYTEYKHPKFTSKYVCYARVWDDTCLYTIHETINGSVRQKMELTQTQFEHFIANLERNGWQKEIVAS
jgi:hypothetical protein